MIIKGTYAENHTRTHSSLSGIKMSLNSAQEVIETET